VIHKEALANGTALIVAYSTLKKFKNSSKKLQFFYKKHPKISKSF
jgi:hypothetical protein